MQLQSVLAASLADPLSFYPSAKLKATGESTPECRHWSKTAGFVQRSAEACRGAVASELDLKPRAQDIDRAVSVKVVAWIPNALIVHAHVCSSIRLQAVVRLCYCFAPIAQPPIPEECSKPSRREVLTVILEGGLFLPRRQFF